MGKLALTGVARGRKKGIRALHEYYMKRRSSDALARMWLSVMPDCPKDAERLMVSSLKRTTRLCSWKRVLARLLVAM